MTTPDGPRPPAPAKAKATATAKAPGGPEFTGARFTGAEFTGAKLALFHGARVLALQRDNRPGLPWPGFWDLPGGGREGDETPETCALRELQEELSLTLAPDRIEARLCLPAMADPSRRAWFFAGRLAPAEIPRIRLGHEGQAWALMPVRLFLARPDAIPALQDRLRRILSPRLWPRNPGPAADLPFHLGRNIPGERPQALGAAPPTRSAAPATPHAIRAAPRSPPPTAAPPG